MRNPIILIIATAATASAQGIPTAAPATVTSTVTETATATVTIRATPRVCETNESKLNWDEICAIKNDGVAQGLDTACANCVVM